MREEHPVSLGGITQRLLTSELRTLPEQPQDICEETGLPYTAGALLVAAMWLKAFRGDVNAAKLVREMNGESDSSASGADLSGMSDAALWTLAGMDDPFQVPGSGSSAPVNARTEPPEGGEGRARVVTDGESGYALAGLLRREDGAPVRFGGPDHGCGEAASYSER